MEKNQLKDLLEKFALGTVSEEEREQFNIYLQVIDGQEYEEILNTYHDMLGNQVNYSFSGGDLLERIKHKVDQGRARTSYKLWYRIAVAAVLLLTISTALFFYTRTNGHNERVAMAAGTESFTTGKNEATLTLANGQKISLNDVSNGEIANQSGIRVTKAANGQLVYHADPVSARNVSGKPVFNTVTTPKGGQYEVNLPDGTKVWLNASSSLTYPTFFTTAGRRVVLKGEAYFEVAKVSAKGRNSSERVPFLVQTDDQEVEVLGTHFNVNAYPDDPSTKTTLLEGSVRVTTRAEGAAGEQGSRPSGMLKPGEQALLEAGKITVKNVEAQDVIAWKDGYVQFQDEGIRAIMRKIERAYDVEVVYKGEISDEPLGGKVSKRTLSELLSTLESTEQFRFKVEGRRITVMP